MSFIPDITYILSGYKNYSIEHRIPVLFGQPNISKQTGSFKARENLKIIIPLNLHKIKRNTTIDIKLKISIDVLRRDISASSSCCLTDDAL